MFFIPPKNSSIAFFLSLVSLDLLDASEEDVASRTESEGESHEEGILEGEEDSPEGEDVLETDGVVENSVQEPEDAGANRRRLALQDTNLVYVLLKDGIEVKSGKAELSIDEEDEPFRKVNIGGNCR